MTSKLIKCFIMYVIKAVIFDKKNYYLSKIKTQSYCLVLSA